MEVIAQKKTIQAGKGKFLDGWKLGEIEKTRAQEIHVKGGIASGRARREKRAAREVMRELLAAPYLDDDSIKQALNKLGIESTQQAALLLKMIKTSGKNALMAQTVFQLSGDLEQQQTTVNIYNSMSDEQLQQERQRLVNVTNDSCIDITPETEETTE